MTIIVPVWMVWAAIAAMFVSAVLNIWQAVLTRKQTSIYKQLLRDPIREDA